VLRTMPDNVDQTIMLLRVLRPTKKSAVVIVIGLRAREMLCAADTDDNYDNIMLQCRPSQWRVLYCRHTQLVITIQVYDVVHIIVGIRFVHFVQVTIYYHPVSFQLAQYNTWKCFKQIYRRNAFVCASIRPIESRVYADNINPWSYIIGIIRISNALPRDDFEVYRYCVVSKYARKQRTFLGEFEKLSRFSTFK